MIAVENSIDETLLALLQCPRTGSPLRLASPAEVESINRQIQAGECTDANDETVGLPVESGLVSLQGDWFYAIRDAIPTLIADEAIALNS